MEPLQPTQSLTDTPMREVTHPMMDGFTSEHLRVFAGPDGAGGAPHYYQVCRAYAEEGKPDVICEIDLQEGHPGEVGINGIGNQTLLLIALDFLQKVNKGSFGCRENSVGITKLEEALQWGKQREMERKGRGVLQTYKP